MRCYECGASMKKPYAILHWSHGRPPKNYCWLCWAKLGINSIPDPAPKSKPLWAWLVIVSVFSYIGYVFWISKPLEVAPAMINKWSASALCIGISVILLASIMKLGESK